MSVPHLMLEIAALLTLAVVLGLVARRVHLPLTVVLVCVGFLAAAVGITPTVGELEGEAFEEVVVFLFLPLLVFAAALGIDLRAFVRNVGSILALAVLAFAVSAVLVGLALHLVLGTALAVAFLFGALISATDPVAVVAIFREVGVPKRLLTLVEGESLLNDGVAIVLFSILLEAALGEPVSVLAGIADFVGVFAGGAALGALIGLAAALLLPWLHQLPAVALSLSVAYGSFVLADEVLGFSGVMATAAAGMVLAGLAPSRASAEIRESWEQTWDALDYVANALLFLLIGLVLGPTSLADEIGPILLAVVAVLVARALAVVPVVWLLERFAHVPAVGRRNEAVLVWGGLRGGVALALALALPEDLAERDLLVALTGGVVLATLLLNATTIRWLVHRLGLDEPSQVDRFLAVIARLSAVEAARKRLADLGLDNNPEVDARLERTAHSAQSELEQLHLDEDAQLHVVLSRGLQIERKTYQSLSDEGLLPPTVTRTLLHETDDVIDDLALRGAAHIAEPGQRKRTALDRLTRWVVAVLPSPAGEEPEELADAEASARRLAARRTGEALEMFHRLPEVSADTVDVAHRMFAAWEQRATDQLDDLYARSDRDSRRVHDRQALMLARAAANRELDELAALGLLPAGMGEAASADLVKPAGKPGG